ncbi:MAG: prepilin peptidase [Anaerolineales bacterium]
MLATVTIALSLLGLGVGIVINGLADHLPHRVNSAWPACHYCQQPYDPGRWSSVVAYLTGRGRCSHCRAPIALRAVLVDLAAVGILLFLAVRLGPTTRFWLLALLLEAFLLITVIDIEHRLILFVVVIPTALIALLYGLLGTDHTWQRTLAGGAAAYGFTYFVYLCGGWFARLMARVRGAQLDEIAFGGGDVNLAGAIGLATAWPGVFLALLFGVTIAGAAAAFVLLIGLLRRRYRPFTAIPYGPFLVVGAAAVLVFGPEIQAWYFGR